MNPNKRDLKAYVRLDGQGRVVAGSLILRKRMPKVGKWYEIPAYECCNTTTTTLIPLCATYSYVQGDISALLSYTDCDGTPRGPFGMNGVIDDIFCCLEGTASVDVQEGVTITFLQYGCNLLN